MKSLTYRLNESFNKETIREYHLSYDVIDLEKSLFKDSDEARTFILEKLYKLDVIEVISPCKSTIVFKYKNKDFNFEKLDEYIKDIFFYSICMVAETENVIQKFNMSKDISNEKLQECWENIKNKE